jgi:ribA/ribD-fused uncharacterized protein
MHHNSNFYRINKKMSEKFTYFWGEAPFSQWCDSTFVIDGITYSCTEQWMMAEKARLFGDTETLALIMEAQLPSDQKKLGRKVKGFNVDKWNAVAKDVVYKGNYAKFTQNPAMKECLLATIGTTLVEASPYDKIWGIGMSAFDAMGRSREEWKGLNWLGEVLTQLRNDLDTGEWKAVNCKPGEHDEG